MPACSCGREIKGGESSGEAALVVAVVKKIRGGRERRELLLLHNLVEKNQSTWRQRQIWTGRDRAACCCFFGAFAHRRRESETAAVWKRRERESESYCCCCRLLCVSVQYVREKRVLNVSIHACVLCCLLPERERRVNIGTVCPLCACSVCWRARQIEEVAGWSDRWRSNGWGDGVLLRYFCPPTQRERVRKTWEIKRGKDSNLMIVVKRKLDNLNLEGISHTKVDDLNSLKIIFLKINFENEFWIYTVFICVRFWTVTQS